MASANIGAVRTFPAMARAHFIDDGCCIGRDDPQSAAPGTDLVFTTECDGLVTRALVGTAVDALAHHLGLSRAQAVLVAEWVLKHESLLAIFFGIGLAALGTFFS